ncbi:hypothetical protein MKK63_30825 [Methylobacterium sp. J-088]|uniref:hypothetical protein n=1 Tax=Methylobacterium sp. J-088 TaxID=2836664 RepID=UPI001FBBFF1C|nr:hypothetical protein [Methylobacterium sp. J-088]MCJ2067052.1 hypothetical protein [Methylobacterium sp. J-088]
MTMRDQISDANLPAHIARQIEACEALLPTVDLRHRVIAERSLLALRDAQAEADEGDLSGARLTLMLGMGELLSAAIEAQAVQSMRRLHAARAA